MIGDAATECVKSFTSTRGNKSTHHHLCTGRRPIWPTADGTFSTTDTRIRRRTPQGLSLHSISKKKAKSRSAPLFVSPQQELQLALGDVGGGGGSSTTPSYPLLSSGPVISRNTFCGLEPAISRRGNPPPVISVRQMPRLKDVSAASFTSTSVVLEKKKSFLSSPFAFTRNEAQI